MPIIINHGGFAESNAVSPQDTGFTNMTTHVNAFGGVLAWINPGDAKFADNNPAIAGSFSGITSRFLSSTGGEWPPLPPTAQIDGIEMRYKIAALPTVLTSSILLVVAGVQVGTDHSLGQFWPGVSTFFVRGSPTDLWGAGPLTGADVNASNFGVSVQCVQNGGSGFIPSIAALDQVQMRIYYTA